MKEVLVLDTETGGLDPSDPVVEIGAAVYLVETNAMLVAYSSLVNGTSNAAHHINGIPPAALIEGADEAAVWARLTPWVERADAIIAHNAEFDRGHTPPGWDMGKPWICSRIDIVWPQYSSSRKLVDIMLAHGLGVSHVHRALADVISIVRLFERCAEMGHSVDDMLTLAMRPKFLYRALVSYNQKDQARACGFSWNATSKWWTRRLVEEDASAFPFEVVKVA